jgi:hypothetical protein
MFSRDNKEPAYAWQREVAMLTPFAETADALREIGAMDLRDQPGAVRRAVGELGEFFGRLVNAWGWERLAEPPEERAAYVADCRTRFMKARPARDYFDTLVSWQAGTMADGFPPEHEGDADLARRDGITPTMTPQEARNRWPDVEARYKAALALGRVYPRIEAAFDEVELRPAWDVLNLLIQIVEQRTARPFHAWGEPETNGAIIQLDIATDDPRDFVTLDQMAAIARKGKRQVRRWHDEAKLPPPSVVGARGKAHLWKWKDVRSILAELTGIAMPEKHPAMAMSLGNSAASDIK